MSQVEAGTKGKAFAKDDTMARAALEQDLKERFLRCIFSPSPAQREKMARSDGWAMPAGKMPRATQSYSTAGTNGSK